MKNHRGTSKSTEKARESKKTLSNSGSCEIIDAIFNTNKTRGSIEKLLIEEWKCKICKKIFPDKSKLQRHSTAVHVSGEEKRSGNSPIEKLDFQQQKLREVEELLKKDNGDWKCKECSKTFSLKGDLRKHAEMHVTGLSFPCTRCSKIFPTRSRLADHKYLNHRGEKR